MVALPQPIQGRDQAADIQAMIEALPRVHRTLSASFPRLCPSLVEDAVQSAVLVLISRPCLLQNSAEGDGGDQITHLLRVIGWRTLRAGLRRGSRETLSHATVEWADRFAVPAAQDKFADLRMHLAEALDMECAHSDGSTESVRGALEDSLCSGDPDTVVAMRHGIRREYLNRARRGLQVKILILLS